LNLTLFSIYVKGYSISDGRITSKTGLALPVRKSYHVTNFKIGWGDNVDELKELYNNAFSYAEGFGYNTSDEWKVLTDEAK